MYSTYEWNEEFVEREEILSVIPDVGVIWNRGKEFEEFIANSSVGHPEHSEVTFNHP